MKQLNNRQKKVVRARESIQKNVLATRQLQKGRKKGKGERTSGERISHQTMKK